MIKIAGEDHRFDFSIDIISSKYVSGETEKMQIAIRMLEAYAIDQKFHPDTFVEGHQNG